METIKQPTSLNPTGDQKTSAAPQRKGGFVQGVAVQGCCGEPSGGSAGCCGAPAQVAAPTTAAQGKTQGGCCGTAVTQNETTTASTSCCR